jgi:hypothetical protein
LLLAAARGLGHGAFHRAGDLVGDDKFGWRALAAAAEREHESIENLIAEACGYFVAEVEAGRLASRVPAFVDRSGRGEPRELELRLPARIWRVLEAEAGKQGAELSGLVEHASLLYLADLDSGRAARRILDDEQQD